MMQFSLRPATMLLMLLSVQALSCTSTTPTVKRVPPATGDAAGNKQGAQSSQGAGTPAATQPAIRNAPDATVIGGISESATPGASAAAANPSAPQAPAGTGAPVGPGTVIGTPATTAAPAATPRRAPYAPVPAGYNDAMITQWVDAHRAAKGSDYKYLFVPPADSADPATANILRVAAAKAWNHLSFTPALDLPEDVSGGAGLVLAVKPAAIWGDAAGRNWGFLANCSPKANIRISPAPRGDCSSFDADKPVAIPRFVFNATNGGPYANIMETPPNYRSFQAKYKLGPVAYTSTHKNAIVCGPRISGFRPVTINGVATWYSFTTDEFNGRDGGDIRYQRAPTDQDLRSTGSFKASPNDTRTAVASEWWIQLPNGFMYWGIHGEGAQERGKAEFPFAIDPANWKQNNVLATGRSCMTCHGAGVQSAPSDEAFAGKDGWTSNADLSAFYKTIRDKFQGSMTTIVAALSDGDDTLNSRMIVGTVEVLSKAIMLVEGRYTGGNGCNNFCRGKFGTKGANLCEVLPAK